jgi:hypothetical protein
MHRAGRLAVIGWLLAALLVLWVVASATVGVDSAGQVPQITVGGQSRLLVGP